MIEIHLFGHTLYTLRRMPLDYKMSGTRMRAICSYNLKEHVRHVVTKCKPLCALDKKDREDFPGLPNS